MSDSEITLREYFDQKVDHMEEMRCADQKALGLQAREYERRLDALNHEQTRIATIQATYVPREVFDNWRHEIEVKIADLREYRSNITGRLWGVGVIIGIVVTVINVVLKRVFQ